MTTIQELRKTIKIGFEDITPEVAVEMLQTNTRNRRLRPGHVAKLSWAFQRGEYEPTHQGIAFDSEGVLLDGQNRLHAIAACQEGQSFPMLVSHGWNRDKCWKNIDTSLAIRSFADVLEIPKPHAEISNVFARLLMSSSNTTPAYVKPIAEFFQDEYIELHDYCPSTGKMWGSAPVRAAALYMMKTGNSNYAKLVFKSLATMHFETMPPVAHVAYRMAEKGEISAVQKFETFARCVRIFDKAYANHSKIKMKVDQPKVLQETREFLESALFKTAERYEARTKALA